MQSLIPEYFTPRSRAFLETLSDDDRAAFMRALVTRGKRRGMLKAKPPSAYQDPHAFAAWHGFKAAEHASRWGYLPNDCGIAGMVMNADSGCGETFSRVFDAAIDASKKHTAKA